MLFAQARGYFCRHRGAFRDSLAPASASLLGKPKIQDLGVAARRDEDVGGLQVTVNDSLGVSRVEGVGNLDGEFQQQFQLERATRDAVL
jgi:hypothetical protein